MKSKEELIEKITEIDKQLNKNCEALNPYHGSIVEIGSPIWMLTKLTLLLLEKRINLCRELADHYWIIII